MSRRYVNLFDAYAESDAIVVVGFGFNKDDSHINGLFRELVENKGRRLILISRSKDGTVETQKRRLRDKLRISHTVNHLLTVIPVDDTRCENGQLWLEQVINTLHKELS